MLGIGGNQKQSQPQQQPQQQQGFNSPYPQNVSKTVEVELGKFIVKIDELELDFYKSLAGWMTVFVDDEVHALGMRKSYQRETIEIDYDGRMMNDKGANHAYRSLKPLIMPATAMSNLRETTIYNNWKARLPSLRMSFLDSYHFPKLRCKSCRFNTSKFNEMHYHLVNTRHSGYRKIINPYEIDIDRLQEIMTTIANLHVLTYKASGGFTAREVLENYVNTSNNGNQGMMPMMPMQSHGFWDKLVGNPPRQF